MNGTFSTFSTVFAGAPTGFLQALQSHGDIAVSPTLPNGQGFSGPSVGAVTTMGGNPYVFLGVKQLMPQITINPNGFFFTGTIGGTAVQNIAGSGFQGLTSLAQIQEAVILHELGRECSGPTPGLECRPGQALSLPPKSCRTAFKHKFYVTWANVSGHAHCTVFCDPCTDLDRRRHGSVCGHGAPVCKVFASTHGRNGLRLHLR